MTINQSSIMTYSRICELGLYVAVRNLKGRSGFDLGLSGSIRLGVAVVGSQIGFQSGSPANPKHQWNPAWRTISSLFGASVRTP
jgi:hypothetical protein